MTIRFIIIIIIIIMFRFRWSIPRYTWRRYDNCFKIYVVWYW